MAEALRHVTLAGVKRGYGGSDNRRLKKMVTDRDLEPDVFRRSPERIVGPRVRCQQVAYAQRGLSSRRTCALLPLTPSTASYTSRPAVRTRGSWSRAVSRYGCGNIRIVLKRRGQCDEPQNGPVSALAGSRIAAAAAPAPTPTTSRPRPVAADGSE